jgi:hypothetical protein
MEAVKVQIAAVYQPDDDTNADPQREARNVNKGIEFVSREDACCDPEIGPEHSVGF